MLYALIKKHKKTYKIFFSLKQKEWLYVGNNKPFREIISAERIWIEEDVTKKTLTINDYKIIKSYVNEMIKGE